jgi:hypothetical protein
VYAGIDTETPEVAMTYEAWVERERERWLANEGALVYGEISSQANNSKYKIKR